MNIFNSNNNNNNNIHHHTGTNIKLQKEGVANGNLDVSG